MVYRRVMTAAFLKKIFLITVVEYIILNVYYKSPTSRPGFKTIQVKYIFAIAFCIPFIQTLRWGLSDLWKTIFHSSYWMFIECNVYGTSGVKTIKVKIIFSNAKIQCNTIYDEPYAHKFCAVDIVWNITCAFQWTIYEEQTQVFIWSCVET